MGGTSLKPATRVAYVIASRFDRVAPLAWRYGLTAVHQVDEIRALYGRMLSDIAYRIENSPFFDSSVPTTRQFETSLAMWSDVIPSTSDDEVVRRSAVVAVAFGTARSHAEVVGLGAQFREQSPAGGLERTHSAD